MIQEFPPERQAAVDAISEKKHIWWDITRIVVYTGADIPTDPLPDQIPNPA